MDEGLKRAIMAIDRSVTEISSLIRCSELELSDDEISDLFLIEEVQSRALAQLVNIGQRVTGGDEFLSEIEAERDQWSLDPYPGDDGDEAGENADVLQTFIDVNS